MNFQLFFNKIFRSNPVLQQKGVCIDDIGFSILLALISTVISYNYAVGNQLEQLPIILRQLDIDYLSKDFFLSTTDDFGPRTYFIVFLGFISQFITISWAYACLTFISDIALVVVTLWAARTIIGTNRLGAMLAATMTLGLASFHLGDATQIRYEIFQPASLAIPGALIALVMGFKGRPVSAAIIASLAGLAHPLYGAEGGGIALGIAFLALLLPSSASGQSSKNFISQLNWGLAFKRTLPGAVILGSCLALFWWLPYRNVNAGVNLSTEEFYSILARFRAPHHYLPSHFRVNDYISAFFFLIATAFAFSSWAKGRDLRSMVLLLFPISVVLVACVLAYIFAEVWPVRVILTLQLFRLLFILKWLGFLLIGAVLSSYILQPPSTIARSLSLISLLSTGVAQPLLTSISLASVRLYSWRLINSKSAFFLFLISLVALFLWSRFSDLSELVYLVFAYGLILATVIGNSISRILATTAIAILVVLLVLNRGAEEYSNFFPVFNLSDQHGIKAETARAIANVTPEDALLITPPEFGLLRIIGGRALIVDFKSIPFQDLAMKQWQQRIQKTYGNVNGGGFRAAKSLDKAYRLITDKKLLELSKFYGATHALLYVGTKTMLPELYVNDDYRIVSLLYN